MGTAATTASTETPMRQNRATRQKRISKDFFDDDDKGSLMEDAANGASVVVANSASLLACLSFGLVWFAFLAQLACASRGSDELVVAAPQTRWDDAGLFMATGSLGLGKFTESDAISKHCRNKARPAMRKDAGMALATGSLLLSDDLATEIWPQAASPDTREERREVAPQKPPSSFAVVAALVHTLLAGIGFALGKEALSGWDWKGTFMRTTLAAFAFLCGTLWGTWHLSLGPLPSTGALVFGSGVVYVLTTAISMCGWLACSMLLSRSGVLDSLRSHSPVQLCSLATACLSLYLLDMPGVGAATGASTILALIPAAWGRSTAAVVARGL